MKQKIKPIIIAVFGIIIFTIQFAAAQYPWINMPGSTNTFHQPNYTMHSTVESVGVGDFATAIAAGFGTQPRSAFHIGTNYYFGPPATPSYVNLGEVFRTTCPADVSTFWRMEREGGERGFNEYGMLYTLGGADEAEPRSRIALVSATAMRPRL